MEKLKNYLQNLQQEKGGFASGDMEAQKMGLVSQEYLKEILNILEIYI